VKEQIDRDLRKLMRLERSSHAPALVAPGVIWWKAQLLERRRKQQQALLPVRFFRVMSFAAIFVIGLALLYVGARLKATDPALLGFAGVLVLMTYLPSVWVRSKISAKSK
jgi:hypothetical protein